MVLRKWQDCLPYLDRMQTLDQLVFAESAWTRTSWKGLFDNRRLMILPVFVGEELIAFAAIAYVEDEGELLRIVVKEAERRKGVGGRLIDEAVIEMGGLGVKKIFLEVREDNEAAIALYQQKQFMRAGERKAYYNRPVCGAIVFVKEI